MPNISDTISDSLTIQQINLLRAAIGHEKEVLRMLGSLERELASELQDVVGKTDFTVARMRELLTQTRESIAAAYGRIAVANQAGLVDVATVAGHQTVKAVNAAIGAAVTSVEWAPEQVARLASGFMVNGGTAAQWWAQQDQSLRDAFQREMQLGQLRGETVGQLTQRVRGTKAMGYKDGIMETPRRQAQALVRTAALGVANAARLDIYAKNDDVIRGVQWTSTLDPRTCVICMGLDGLAWDFPGEDGKADYADYVPAKRGPWAQWHKKKFEPPPIHFNCRCVVVPVTWSWKDLAGEHGNSKAAAIADRIPENKRASMDGQVAASMTFDKWLGTKPVEFQNNVLGLARAEAWRKGEVKLQGLADQSHHPLNLRQLGIEAARRAVLPQTPLPPVTKPTPLPTKPPVPIMEGPMPRGPSAAVPGVEQLQAAVKEAEKKLPPPPATKELPPLARQMGVRVVPPVSGSGPFYVNFPVRLPDGAVIWRLADWPMFPDEAAARAFVEGHGYKVAEYDPAKLVPIPKIPPVRADTVVLYKEQDGWRAFWPVAPNGQAYEWQRIGRAWDTREEAEKSLKAMGYKVRGIEDMKPGPRLPMPRGPKEQLPQPAFMRPKPGETSSSPLKMQGGLKDKAVREFKPDKGGSSSAIPVVFEDGSKAMFKPMTGESTAGRSYISYKKVHAHDREAAASDIADILGMSDPATNAVVPATVIRDFPGKGIGSLQDFAPAGSVEGYDANIAIRFDGPKDEARAAAWDFLIGHSDRHGKNWMVRQTDGKMWLIDNGLAFPAPYRAWEAVDEQFRSEIFADARRKGLNVPAETVDWLEKWPKIEEYMKKKGFNEREIGSMFQRMQILASNSGKPFNKGMFGGVSVWDG